MKVRYDNEQNTTDPMNGKLISENMNLLELLDDRRREHPFIFRLSGDNGFELLVGLGLDLGCVQYSASNGDPPYLMAVSARPPMKRGYMEFLTANTPTPFAARYIISFDELKEIALYFLQAGERSNVVSWQILNPKAIREDVERGDPH